MATHRTVGHRSPCATLKKKGLGDFNLPGVSHLGTVPSVQYSPEPQRADEHLPRTSDKNRMQSRALTTDLDVADTCRVPVICRAPGQRGALVFSNPVECVTVSAHGSESLPGLSGVPESSDEAQLLPQTYGKPSVLSRDPAGGEVPSRPASPVAPVSGGWFRQRKPREPESCSLSSGRAQPQPVCSPELGVARVPWKCQCRSSYPAGTGCSRRDGSPGLLQRRLHDPSPFPFREDRREGSTGATGLQSVLTS